ncbi:isochorismatase family protein [Companilactobacillus metriopterae]|uniref:isochorismatase family protein n=1 Tax=Companilactobacillus metriopterae TaxID=1909267 RepID=UPI001F507837|nr:isochorismatase family protein [Companilactobacillus metriopterae]
METKKALLVLDMQNGLSSSYDFETVLEKINKKIDTYRDNNDLIVFMKHVDDFLKFDTFEGELVKNLNRLEDDRVILKNHSNSFYETGLDSFLKHQKITDIEVCGLQTEYCVDTAIRTGHYLGYNMSIQSGYHTTFGNDLLEAKKVIEHHELIWGNMFASVK